MTKTRAQIAAALARGLLAAVALTLAGMALIAALAVYARISDGAIAALNQVLKFAAIALGALVAVGRGGERGFLTAMTLAALYMVLGYGMVVALGGLRFAAPDMLGEILIGAAAGGLMGAVVSNLPEKGRRRVRAVQ